MNPQIEKLYKVAEKPSRLIIGLMSGTSLDGLDIALCKFTGSGRASSVEVLQFATVPYAACFKKAIREVFAKDNILLPHLCRINPWIGTTHGNIINNCLLDWGVKNAEIDAIASHGQTVMHSPKRLHGLKQYPNSTLQIGDGDHLAVETGILTLSDFRQKHCAVGGEGAPLALYGDYLLLSSEVENRVLINIGGIANFTFLPKTQDFNTVFATDTGPGNTMLDAYVQLHFHVDYDKNATIGRSGVLNKQLLDKLLDHSYFQNPVPKTTGPELFNLSYLDRCLDGIQLKKEDVVHTLCHFTALTLSNQIKTSVPVEKYSVYLSGGGMHNPLICELIENELKGLKVANMNKLGISGDAKEAVLFAALANETLAGNKGFIPPKDSSSSFFMGKISFPQ